jgi:hypothetical protein
MVFYFLNIFDPKYPIRALEFSTTALKKTLSRALNALFGTLGHLGQKQHLFFLYIFIFERKYTNVTALTALSSYLLRFNAIEALFSGQLHDLQLP